MQRQADEVEDEEGGGGALSLDRARSAVRKRLKLVVAMTVVAAVMTAAIVWVMPNSYNASAVIQIDPRFKSITNLDSVVSDMKGDNSSVESEVEIVRSRPIILQVIETLDLRNDPEFAQPSLKTQLMIKLGLASIEKVADRAPQRPRDQIADILKVDEPGISRPERDAIADEFAKRLRVMRVRNTLLIDIRFSANDAAKSARIANTIAETYLKDQLGSKTRAANTAANVLEEKLNEMRLEAGRRRAQG